MGAPGSASTVAATDLRRRRRPDGDHLAQILQRGGAVRAMELDINPEWHTLITYTHQHGHLVPTMVEPQPMQSVNRYLVPDNRDFFAVYRRVPGLVTVPFK